MKVAISLQYNQGFANIAALTAPVIQAYALRHGYSIFVHKCEQESPEIVWQRVQDVNALLDSHDAVVHLDADCLITNPEVTIESLMAGDDADLFMSTDCNGINDGFHIWRSTGMTRGAVFRLCLAAKNGDYTSPQDALSKKLSEGLEMKRFPQRLTNSYLMAEYPDLGPDEAAEWQEGDFILHTPGVGNARRVEIIKQHLQRSWIE